MCMACGNKQPETLIPHLDMFHDLYRDMNVSPEVSREWQKELFDRKFRPLDIRRLGLSGVCEAIQEWVAQNHPDATEDELSEKFLEYFLEFTKKATETMIRERLAQNRQNW